MYAFLGRGSIKYLELRFDWSCRDFIFDLVATCKQCKHWASLNTAQVTILRK